MQGFLPSTQSRKCYSCKFLTKLRVTERERKTKHRYLSDFYFTSAFTQNFFKMASRNNTKCESGTDLSSSKSKYPCGKCDREVSWEGRGVACESCGIWFHATCQGIGKSSYINLGDEDVTWHCTVCGNPNYSDIPFDLYSIHCEEPDLKFDLSQNSIPSISPTKTFKPVHASTPTRANQQDKVTNRPLRVISVNFNSIVAKRAELANVIVSVRPDIIIGTETKLDKEVQDAEFMPNSYRVHRKDRNRNGGGVMVAVKKDIQSIVVSDLDSDCEILWVKIITKDKGEQLICAYYRPHVSDAESLYKFDQVLRKASQRGCKITIAGDLNFPSLDWENIKLKPKAEYPALHNHLVDLLNDLGMEQLITEPTHEDGNTLDLVITNTPSLIPRVEVMNGVSDHDIVYFELRSKVVIKNTRTKPMPIYDKANWTEIRGDMALLRGTIENMAQKKETKTEELVTKFNKECVDSVKRHVPHRTKGKKRESYPWITITIKKLIRRRDRQYRKMKKKGTKELKDEVKMLKKEIQKKLRRAKWDYTNRLFAQEEGESNRNLGKKRFWTYIKHQRKSQTGIHPLKDVLKGELITDPEGKAELLSKQFKKAFSDGKEYTKAEFEEKCDMPKQDYPAIPDFSIDPAGVEKLLKNLDPFKAPGPDEISPRFLKELSKEIAPILSVIYNHSLQTGEVPPQWKAAYVTPIFKKRRTLQP